MHQQKVGELKTTGPYEVVGRDSRIDLSRYTITLNGRRVIDYEKLKSEDPNLYEDILKTERERDLNN